MARITPAKTSAQFHVRPAIAVEMPTRGSRPRKISASTTSLAISSSE
jgi:hypothetical protein